jgi:AraC-like DNA-binding protein
MRWSLSSAGDPQGECNAFSEHMPERMRRRELPSRHAGIILAFGDPLGIVPNMGDVRWVRSFVTGLQTASAVTERIGYQHGMHLRLSPLAARRVVGVPMGELVNTLVDLGDVWGAEGRDLVDRLACLPGWPERAACLREVIRRRTADSERRADVVDWAWRRLRATHGTVRVEQLVREAGVSHRHLVALFRDRVGLSPKELARVLRFENAVRSLRSDTPIAATAAAAGYYDQAHLHREFRLLAGGTPQELLKGSDFSNTGRPVAG